MVSAPPAPITDDDRDVAGSHPRLIFFTRLDAAGLRRLLMYEGLLEHLVLQAHGIALAVTTLDDVLADVVRHLNSRGIYTVAWLLMPVEYGGWFNAQNYPQAKQHYRAFHAWAQQHALHFDALGMDIKPPIHDIPRRRRWRLRDIAWQIAHDDVLSPAASAAYADLVAEMHRDGYQVHSYQLPLLADDRRAGTTLLQRGLHIVDIPADMEVLLCFSSTPVENLPHDMGGALIASYRPAADSIAVGSIDAVRGNEQRDARSAPLTWEALQRDLLLAARYTDTIYVFSLEGCIESGYLPRIAGMEWSRDARPVLERALQLTTMRLLLFATLIVARFHRAMLAWAGWVLAVVLLLQRVRWGRRQRSDADY